MLSGHAFTGSKLTTQNFEMSLAEQAGNGAVELVKTGLAGRLARNDDNVPPWLDLAQLAPNGLSQQSLDAISLDRTA